MVTTNLLRSVLGLLLVVNLATAIQWDFDFGERHTDEFQINEKDGDIGLFSYRNYFKVEVPFGADMTSVHVTVWSVSPPKVDVNWNTSTVEIVYAWSQITVSSYKIIARGVEFLPPGAPKSPGKKG